MSRRSLRTLELANKAGDIAILIAASFISALDHGHVHWRVALVMSVAAASLWLACGRLVRQYDRLNGRSFLGDIALTVLMLVAVAVPMGLLRAVSPRYAMTTQLSNFLLVLLPAVLWLRIRVVGVRLLGGRPSDQVLVVGIGPLARHTHRTIVAREARREVIGYLRFEGEDDDPRLGAPVLGTSAGLETVLRERIVDEVYFAPPAPRPHARVQEGVATCERLGIPFALPACDYRLGRARPAGSASSDGYVHYLSVRHYPLQSAVKRMLDIVVSFSALVLLSPVLLCVAAAIKLASPGPILFRQQRVGLHGRTFEMLKFRSMVVGAHALLAALAGDNEQTGPVFKMTRDPRVTSVGRFIRRHSIDELPQLVNVLRGDMSLVGPRPPLSSEVAKYEAWQRRRLSVRPGLTCVWQVSGRNQISFEEWMMLDMRYIDHWTLFEDLRLIVRTVPVLLTGRGAS